MGKTEFSQDNRYGFLIECFSEEEIISRYEWIYDLIQDYVAMRKISDMVSISDDVLNHVIIDFFVDVKRLKDFSNITHEHDSKIYAYLAYWILRHKPIQIIAERADAIAFVNEDFVKEFLGGYLFSNPSDVVISGIKRDEVDNFVETLLYYFKYRHFDAQSIELMILSFVAGRGYQYSVDHTN